MPPEQSTLSTLLLNPDYNRAVSIFEFKVRDLNKQPVKLEIYRGCVCIVVNVASKSRLSYSGYKSLNQVYEQFRDKGLRILAFPCNQFGMEPGTNEEIASFAAQHDVKFDMFDKVDVNGHAASPLWKYLKLMVPGEKHGDFIRTDFTKFIVKRNGLPFERIAPEANAEVMQQALEPFLSSK